MEHRTAEARRPRMATCPSLASRLIVLLLATGILGACGTDEASAPPLAGIVPTCGGLKVAIDPSLPCERVAEIALNELHTRAPQQLDRGVTAVDVVLAECPRGEVPQQVSCGDAQFAQLVTVTFGPAGDSGLIEPSLTVAVNPVTGAVLGVENPLIR
jgi:hypothetical protein